MTFPATDANGSTVQLLTAAELSAALTAIKTSVDALAPLVDGLEGYTDGIEGGLSNVVAAVNAPSGAQPLPAGAATATKQDAQTAAIGTIGTRAYQAGITALAVGTTSSASAAITATEVLLHASAKCFVRVNAAATVNDIPLEAGEKFTLRIASGNTINAITASGTATLNIVPVA